MSSPHSSESDPRIARAIEDLKGLIQGRYPQASFNVSQGEDPEGIYLDVIVDVIDTDEVFDVVVDRLLDLQVEERLPIHVIPLRPTERVLQELQAWQQRGPRWGGQALLPDEPDATPSPPLSK